METRLRFGALYIRVSTNMQEELSPDAQKRLLLDYAKSNNIIVPEEYIFIELGISGKKADRRPEFQRMIAHAKEKPAPFDVILVWKFSRFARNQDESVLYKSLLRKQCKIDIISVSEPIIDGPFGSLIERIIEWMDEYYSIRLSGEVFRGMSQKALRGGYQARPPLGYRIAAKGEPPVIVPNEAEIIRMIFDKFVNEHMNLFDLARYLNNLGLKTSHEKEFERRSLEYILQNPTYCGMIRWNRSTNETNEIKDKSEWIITEGKHEAIISKELFDAAQERFHKEFTPRGARPTSNYTHWLSGLVKCPACGRTMIAKHMVEKRSGKSYCYFTCYGYNKGKCTAKTSISSKKLEPDVIQALEDVAGNNRLSFSFSSAPRIEENTEQYLLKEQLVRLEDKMERIKAAYRNGVDTLEEYKSNKELILSERKKLTSLLQKSQKEVKQVDCTKQLQNRIRNVADIIISDQFSNKEKNEALRSIVEKIVPNRETDITDIYYHYS